MDGSARRQVRREKTQDQVLRHSDICQVGGDVSVQGMRWSSWSVLCATWRQGKNVLKRREKSTVSNATAQGQMG